MSSPKISVVITSYNHGHYLKKAIASTLNQTLPAWEVIVVDDGSEDDTELVVREFPPVIYIFQPNKGLSAARNTGIDNATGEYVLFLDADDWLYKNALKDQADAFHRQPEVMAVAGDHKKVNEDGTFSMGGRAPHKHASHFLNLLEMNFIGMHAAVLFRKKFFDEFRYDASLRVAEDYDLMLHLTHLYPIYVHGAVIAAYRQHANNMSRNIPLMLSSVLEVLKRREPVLTAAEEKAAYLTGIKFWNSYYTEQLIEQKLHLLYAGGTMNPVLTQPERDLLKSKQPEIIKKITYLNRKNKIKKIIRKLIGPSKSSENILPGKLDWGSFQRTQPISDCFGFDRGLPIDRYYIEKFLEQNQSDIKGRVLEIADNSYTMRFGKSQVMVSDVMHITPNHPGATITGDLAKANEIPVSDQSFDCIILTQTLHLIYEYGEAIRQCYRMLKPGGVLLLTTPGISQIDKGEWNENWLWSFNRQSMTRIIQDNFSPGTAAVSVYGNVFSATSFLWGISLEEIPHKGMMDVFDPAYPVIITVRAIRSQA